MSGEHRGGRKPARTSRGPSQEQLDQAGPKQQDLLREGQPPLPVRASRSSWFACARPAASRWGGTCSRVALPTARSQPRPPRRMPSPGGTPLALPTRPAHLSELPGVLPRPRPPRAPVPRSGSPRVPERPPGLRSPAVGVAVGVAGRGRSLEGPGAPHKARPGAGCSAAPAVSAPRSAGSSRPGTGNDLSSRSLPPRGAAGDARRAGCALRPPGSVGPPRDAHQTGPSLPEGGPGECLATCRKVPPGCWEQPVQLIWS